MSLSKEVVRTVRAMQAAGLTEDLRRKVKLHIADTIGAMLAAGRLSPAAGRAISAVAHGAAGGTGRVIGSHLRLPPAYAAFANCVLGHALDYDDIHDEARVHPTPVALSAALAAADAAGGGGDLPSADLLVATALGSEWICRLGDVLEPRGTGTDAHWFLTQLFGYIGAAISAGLVLGLSDDEMAHALGIAYMQAAGGKEPGIGTGATARAIYPAFAAMGGVQAALLARAGITAPASCLDGEAGLFRIYLGADLDEDRRSSLLRTEPWAYAATQIKLYPCCRYSHPYVRSALRLHHEVKDAEIERIVIGVNATSGMLCRPLAERRRPETLQDAKFSLPFLIAFALAHGEVTLNNLTEAALTDLSVLKLAKRTEIAQSQEDFPGMPVGDITVYTSSGVHQHKETLPPMVAEEEVRLKFCRCCEAAGIAGAEGLWRSLLEEANDDLPGRIPLCFAFELGE
jgi:2-methylcitrate dehydratase PrpD